jgi:hypothetical protein
MYPLTQQFLSLPEIARHWARDLPQRPPVQEIFQTFLNALWRGELREFGSVDHPVRERLLRTLAVSSPHPGILIYDNPEGLPPIACPLPDGGLAVDMRKRIYLPLDPAMWTLEVISNAFAVLVESKMEDYSEAFSLVLHSVEVSKGDFAAFCDALGYERPAFWFGAGIEKKSKSFGGRPSVMRQIEAEMRRRAAERQLAPKLREEAEALNKWAEFHIDKTEQIPTARAIENALRDIYWDLRRQAIKP